MKLTLAIVTKTLAETFHCVRGNEGFSDLCIKCLHHVFHSMFVRKKLK